MERALHEGSMRMRWTCPHPADPLLHATHPRAACRVRFAQGDVWEGYGGDPEADTIDIEIYQVRHVA